MGDLTKKYEFAKKKSGVWKCMKKRISQRVTSALLQRANSGVSNKQILQKVTRDIVQCTFEEKSGFWTSNKWFLNE